MEQIDAELELLLKELIEHGHVFDSSWITRPLVGNESVESVLNGHSERLALAFNFIQRPIPRRIQITKNLRICGDCRECSLGPFSLENPRSFVRSIRCGNQVDLALSSTGHCHA